MLPPLRNNDRVRVVGDSYTAQKRPSRKLGQRLARSRGTSPKTTSWAFADENSPSRQNHLGHSVGHVGRIGESLFRDHKFLDPVCLEPLLSNPHHDGVVSKLRNSDLDFARERNGSQKHVSQAGFYLNIGLIHGYATLSQPFGCFHSPPLRSRQSSEAAWLARTVVTPRVRYTAPLPSCLVSEADYGCHQEPETNVETCRESTKSNGPYCDFDLFTILRRFQPTQPILRRISVIAARMEAPDSEIGLHRLDEAKVVADRGPLARSRAGAESFVIGTRMSFVQWPVEIIVRLTADILGSAAAAVSAGVMGPGKSAAKEGRLA
jgi:hypothetical protein